MDGVAHMLTRRRLLAAGAAAAYSRAVGCYAGSAGAAAARRSVVLLWMDGGPSQLETFAPGPEAQLRSIATRAPGLRVCEGLPLLADRAHLVAVLRDVRSPECNHRRAWYMMHTGLTASPTAALPPRPDGALEALRPEYPAACDLSREALSTLSAYGGSDFGRGCLIARRLVEAGAPFVEVELGGWDTHSDNAPRVRDLLPVLDRAMSALLDDLVERDLLRRTLVVWMGDFGRTAELNRCGGRDHDPRHGCVVMAGAGVRRGVVLDGRTWHVTAVLSRMRAVSGYPVHAMPLDEDITSLSRRLLG